jgi:hypothetical protein
MFFVFIVEVFSIQFKKDFRRKKNIAEAPVYFGFFFSNSSFNQIQFLLLL